MKVVRLSVSRTGRLYLHEMFLVLIFTRGWVDPRAMVRSEGICHWKNPVTPPGIDPGTVRLVVQRLNHYATPGPSSRANIMPYAVRTTSCYLWYPCHLRPIPLPFLMSSGMWRCIFGLLFQTSSRSAVSHPWRPELSIKLLSKAQILHCINGGNYSALY
jgi:hypothetical protein